MKKTSFQVLIALVILGSGACLARKHVQLINLTTRELPSQTEIILTTNGPVEYKETRIENPPCLILSFPQKKIFSHQDDEIILNKGPIKKIKNDHLKKEGKSERQLNMMIIELSQEAPYQIESIGSSIIIRIENPRPAPAASEGEQIKNKNQERTKEEAPPLDSGYLIGPGDVLNIQVWQHPDLSGDATVNPVGDIRFPPLKTLSVIGMTTYQLEESLTEAFSYYLIDPKVFVSVKEYNSQRVIALGEIKTGMYTLKRRTTLLDFLGEIGGTTANSDTFHIKLIKRGGKAETYSLNDLINDPQKSNEVVVGGGDTVYVPPLEINKVYVLGEVKSPRVINIKGRMSVVDAITEAGGCTTDAVTKSVMVIRGEVGSQQGIRVSLSRILKKSDVGQNIELKPGDIVYVPKMFIANIERFIRDMASPITWYFWYVR
jgi:polysaccharide export outer membrane protein